MFWLPFSQLNIALKNTSNSVDATVYISWKHEGAHVADSLFQRLAVLLQCRCKPKENASERSLQLYRYQTEDVFL